jgi:hypothetical protein
MVRVRAVKDLWLGRMFLPMPFVFLETKLTN